MDGQLNLTITAFAEIGLFCLDEFNILHGDVCQKLFQLKLFMGQAALIVGFFDKRGWGFNPLDVW